MSSTAAALNADFDWDKFNSKSYQEHNYQDLRSDDLEILEIVRDHFASHAFPRATLKGIDVGAGPNLYPTLSMLPFCSSLLLYEYSASNVKYLESQVRDLDPSWDKFWRVLEKRTEYNGVEPRRRLAEIGTVRQGNIFELPRRQWDIGTMFFVAESLTPEMDEFDHAVACFARSLVDGAPFAAAFMKDSAGYYVDDRWFPAVAINASHVSQCLKGIARDVEIQEVTFNTNNPLRDGYGGMLIATGFAVAAGDEAEK
ncbi:MAG TPA: SCO2525 family SAM-dependent methyltransferase [Stackebrandtia sp.]|jgi:hypothetical protein|uniref:SCO2525 family SAM-dependent methyltransferase n=1 Tax=Stackebrandtia sp. TaxID=2023065 RepID=UPI002D41EA31|nr:SCO2525 family SAM-dependent methyltransferase [Stackebrandtia sp.]HZE39892.1 SCO2525 family SAM-dependent methyltransferase [Stackebrandtia sp.]